MSDEIAKARLRLIEAWKMHIILGDTWQIKSAEDNLIRVAKAEALPDAADLLNDTGVVLRLLNPADGYEGCADCDADALTGDNDAHS